MRRNDDSTALQNKLRSRHHQEATEVEGDQGSNTWRRDLESEIGTAGLKYDSWRKMEAVAQDKTGRRKVVCGLCSTGSDKT